MSNALLKFGLHHVQYLKGNAYLVLTPVIFGRPHVVLKPVPDSLDKKGQQGSIFY
jgi:hypothetical protein